MNVITKNISAIALALALIVPVGGIALSSYQSSRQPQTLHMEISYVTDFTDARRLAGFADNVFIGRVVEQAGTHTPDGTLPETLFTVNVVRSLKGSLAGQVTVNQQGGFSAQENAVILMEEDRLLEPGKTYLFATKTGGDGRWETLVPMYGDLRIGDAAHQAALTQKFEKAVKEQIKYQP